MKLEDSIKKYKKEQLIYTGEGIQSLAISRIPTGIFIMDLLTGGGIPEGRISEIYGAKSAAKSTTALRIVGNYLANNPTKYAVYADFEGAYEKEWANNFVKDIDRLLLLVPDYGEQGVDALKDLAEADEVGLIVIDSIGMLIPLNEANADAIDQKVGLQAKLVNRLFRLLHPIIIKKRKMNNYLTILVINQLRANIRATGFQSPVMKPGGMMQDFLYSLDIRLYTLKYIEASGIPVKSVHEFTIEKNKLGLPRRSGEFIINLVNINGNTPVGSIDETATVIDIAKKVGIIARNGNKWLVDGIEYATLSDITEAMQNQKLFNTIRKKTLQESIKNILLTAKE